MRLLNTYKYNIFYNKKIFKQFYSIFDLMTNKYIIQPLHECCTSFSQFFINRIENKISSCVHRENSCNIPQQNWQCNLYTRVLAVL